MTESLTFTEDELFVIVECLNQFLIKNIEQRNKDEYELHRKILQFLLDMET